MIGKIRLAGRYVNYLYYQTRDLITGTVALTGSNDDIFNQDWDSLVILDACRYDLFRSTAELEGSLKSRKSRASNTVEFLQNHVADKILHDTVYITANPQYRKFEEDLNAEFHTVIDIWDHAWDREIRTVLPETTTEHTIEMASKYPNKRLLIHYNQPHIPFLGETGRNYFDLQEISDHPLPFWKQPLMGEWNIEDDLIWKAYRENLELTLPYIENLLSELAGRVVVTADHGNMIGDRAFPIPIKEYGHPRGLYYPELVNVPWLVIDDGERKTVYADSPANSSNRARENHQIEDRLRSLGYR